MDELRWVHEHHIGEESAAYAPDGELFGEVLMSGITCMRNYWIARWQNDDPMLPFEFDSSEHATRAEAIQKVNEKYATRRKGQIGDNIRGIHKKYAERRMRMMEDSLESNAFGSDKIKSIAYQHVSDAIGYDRLKALAADI